MIKTGHFDEYQFNVRPYSRNALDLIYKRYLANHDLGIEEWFDRVVAHLVSVYEKPDQEVIKQYQILLKSRAFLPTSAALTNSLSGKGSLAGCIVIELVRDIERVFEDVLPKIVKVQRAGTGVGLDLSIIDPRLFYDEEKKMVSLGPIELLVSIVQAIERPMQYMGVKRAAFMATLFVQHPDIFEFIALKRTHHLAQVNNSVTVDEAFRQAVEQDGLMPLWWEDKGHRFFLTTEVLVSMKSRAEQRSVRAPDLELVCQNQVFSKAANRLVGRVFGGIICVSAKTLLRFIAENAYQCGDPGLLNLHAINEANPTHPRYKTVKSEIGVGIIKTTTPCGEQPLLPNEVCHLGSFNLNSFINSEGFNFKAFTFAIKVAVRLMDDLITVGDNGLIEANLVTRKNRKIGLGIMGLADALAELEIPYDSPEALAFAEQIGATLKTTASKASKDLAIERGPFENWINSKYQREEKRRHATLTTLAPTGHISTLADCSSGIEPYYLLSYQRNAAGIKTENCSVLERKLERIDFSLKDWILETKKRRPSFIYDGMLANLCDNPLTDETKNLYLKKLKKVFMTSQEIKPEAHLAMVKIFQHFIDNGISKTINLHNKSSMDLVESLFLDALSSNLKGITVFRDGCLNEQALFNVSACIECETLPLQQSETERIYDA